MKIKNYFRIISIVLIISQLATFSVFAKDKPAAAVVPIGSIPAVNTAGSSLCIEQEQTCQIFFEYDNSKRLAKMTKRTSTKEEVTTYNYRADGTKEESSVINQLTLSLLQKGDIAAQSVAGDELINNSWTKSLIEMSETSYNGVHGLYQTGQITSSQRDMMLADAHTEADLARADYIIMNPYSPFAYNRLGGSVSTGNPMSRQLYYNQSAPLQGMDVIVIQRVLELYGYLDSPKNKEYGMYDASTFDAVKLYQKEVLNVFSDGVVTSQMYTKLFAQYTDSKRTSSFINMLRIY